MKRFTTLAVVSALAASTLVSSAADAREGRWRGHRSRVIIEQPAAGIGLGIGALLLLSQMGQQKQYVEQVPEYQPQPRRRAVEPKLRDNPIPLK